MNIILFAIKESIHLVRFALHSMFIAFRSWTILAGMKGTESYLPMFEMPFLNERSPCWVNARLYIYISVLEVYWVCVRMCEWVWLCAWVYLRSSQMHAHTHTHCIMIVAFLCKQMRERFRNILNGAQNEAHIFGVGWGLAHIQTHTHTHHIHFPLSSTPNIMKDSYAWNHSTQSTKDGA